jgi:dihydroorotate dehydrogenase
MGFNNQGVDAAVERLKKRKTNIIIGGNIGKNKQTPNENAIDDYAYCFKKLFDVVDYFVVNVSSPNTPNLRALQEKEPLQALLMHLQNLNLSYPNPKPILLKIAPDLNESQLDDVIDIVQTVRLSGIVATNTTIDREGLTANKKMIADTGAGGVSGKPLKQRSTEIIRYIHQKSEGKIPMIAVGGIFNGDDAREKLEAGASLVQVYTGFIYQGPAIAKNICKAILNS